MLTYVLYYYYTHLNEDLVFKYLHFKVLALRDYSLRL
jgi:hypothetical protein